MVVLIVGGSSLPHLDIRNLRQWRIRLFSAYTNFAGTSTPSGFSQSVSGSSGIGSAYLSENNGLNFTIRTSVAGAGFPTGIQAYFSFTIQNTQSSPIPTGSTVSISVPWGQYSPYVASNYQNVEFFNSSRYSMNAWLDGTSNGIGTVWLKLKWTHFCIHD